jgi:hypothetical protein
VTAFPDITVRNRSKSDKFIIYRYMKKITPGLNMTFTFVGSDGYTEEGVEIPIGFSFFYPSF